MLWCPFTFPNENSPRYAWNSLLLFVTVLFFLCLTLVYYRCALCGHCYICYHRCRALTLALPHCWSLVRMMIQELDPCKSIPVALVIIHSGNVIWLNKLNPKTKNVKIFHLWITVFTNYFVNVSSFINVIIPSICVLLKTQQSNTNIDMFSTVFVFLFLL